MSQRSLRTLVALSACALAVPAAASARGTADAATGSGSGSPATSSLAASQSDGTLTLRSVNGTLTLSGKGSVLGQVAGKARVLIDDADPSDGVPVVSGYDRAQRVGKTAVLYSGSDLRFRVLGGQFKLKVVASGISLSYVGRGVATLVVTPGLLPALESGLYSLDGGDTYRQIAVGTTSIIIGSALGSTPASGQPGIVLERP